MSERAVTIRAIDRAPHALDLPSVDAVAALPAEALPSIVTQLAALLATAGARLATTGGPPAQETGRLLSVRQVADRSGMSPTWWYREGRALPFARKLGRTLRFDAAGFAHWLKARRP
jgi:predicted DNA-binding transcriptional regulator AlpA